MDEWDESLYIIAKSDPSRAVGRHQTLLLMRDPDRQRDSELCNRSRSDGLVCRLLAGHNGSHIPFPGDLICQAGIYVVAVLNDDSPLP